MQSIGEMLDIPGRVKLKDPSHTLCLLLDFYSQDCSQKSCNFIYFGRMVGNCTFGFCSLVFSISSIFLFDKAEAIDFLLRHLF